ncbi:MAG: hypothetical protein WCG85_23440 [Polyangia bacterium]
MVTGARVSASWLLALMGLSCTYWVGLPGPAGDAGGDAAETGGAQPSDASIDQSSPGDKPESSHPVDCANSLPLRVVRNQVEMIIALSRSSSMQQHSFDSTTRLQAAQQALSVAIGAHPSIQFGLEQFPGSTECGGATCCADSVSIPPAPDQPSSIESQMACASGDASCAVAGTDSPSHQALRKCRDYYANEGSLGRQSQFVLLVTDQDPTCAGDSSTADSLCASAVAVASQLGARTLGVQTFVVALNSDVSSTVCLANIAAANASGFSGASQFFTATNQQDLHDGLEAIMALAEASLCQFLLGHPPDNPDQVVVTINHDRVPKNSSGQTDGWSFSDNSSSELVVSGSYCDQLKSGQGDSAPVVLSCWP